MKAAIIYASNSGSTYQTAQAIQEILLEHKFDTDLMHVKDTQVEYLTNYELILLGSPSWKVDGKEGQPHEYMQEFLNKLSNSDLRNKKIGIFGCGDNSYLQFCGAVDEIKNHIQQLEGKTLEPTLKIDSFYFDLDSNIERIRKWTDTLASKLEKTTPELVTSLV